MKIAIISDTHKRQEAILQVGQVIKEENPDLILHLGDQVEDADVLQALLHREVRRVPGNCDYSRGEPDFLLIEVEDHKLYAVHGHYQGVKMNLYRLEKEAKDNGATIALYGHTHIAYEETVRGITLFNPGSAALPKGGQKKSMAFLEIHGDKTSFRWVFL